MMICSTAELVFAKWTALHKYLHARPWRLPEGLCRSDQWRQMVSKYVNLGDRELDFWLHLQVEIADNREKGISDLRERRDGPCFLILLEYVGNRKRTALAVLHWAKAHWVHNKIVFVLTKPRIDCLAWRTKCGRLSTRFLENNR